jgi:hypothetical protein
LFSVNTRHGAQNVQVAPPAGNANEGAGNLPTQDGNANGLRVRINSAFNTVRSAFKRGGEESSPPAPAGGDSDNRLPHAFAMPEILDEIAHHLDVVDVFELSKTARRPYWILLRQRKAFKDSVRNCCDKTLVRNGCRSAKELHEHVSSGNPFQEKDTTARELREVLGLPDSASVTTTVRQLIRVVHCLPVSSRREADMQYQAIYLARTLLQASPLQPNLPRTVRRLNGLAKDAIRAAPLLSKDRHWRRPGTEISSGLREFIRHSGPIAFITLFPIVTSFHTTLGLGASLVKEDKNPNRMLNLAMEAMHGLQPGDLSIELVQTITRHLAANPDRDAKHLVALRDEFVRLATPAQRYRAAQELQTIGWM